MHLHAPETKKSDCYTVPSGNVWDEYCRILHESDVVAFGITDYFSADGYIKTRDEYLARYPACKKRFFANIELCLNVVVNKDDDYINIHVIVNPAVSDVQLKKFLDKLPTNKTSAGRVFASELSSTAQYNEATTTKEFLEEAISLTFGDKDRLEHLLMIPAVNNQGIRPKNDATRRKAVSQELDKISDAFFGNSKNAEYYLTTDRWNEGTAPARAVLSGSDAHSFDDLNQHLGKTTFRDGKIHKETTWIKADVTYEGLKQIVFEPEGRVFLGEIPEIFSTRKSKPRRYIKALTINQIDAYDGRFGIWFKDEHIEFSSELIAIVGNKGSGKSAITDVLGLLGNTHKQYSRSEKQEELFSFLNKDKFLKQRCAENFRGELHWYSGTPDTAVLSGVTNVNRAEEVEYLPQKYLERICANVDDSEFRQKLNEVIFGYVKPNETYEKSNLDDLIYYLTNQANEDIQQARGTLHERNKEVVQLEKRLSEAYSTDIQSRIQAAEADLAALEANSPHPVDPPPAQDSQAENTVSEVARLEAKADELRAQRMALTAEQTRLSILAEDLQQAKQALERPIGDLGSMAERYGPLLNSVDLKFGDIVAVSYEPTKLEEAIKAATDRVEAIFPALVTLAELDVEEIVSKSVEALQTSRDASLDWQIQALEARRMELIEGLAKPSRDYQAYLVAKQAWETKRLAIVGSEVDPAEHSLNWLHQELKLIADSYPAELSTKRQLRTDATKKIFLLKKKLLTFLDSIKEAIDKEIESHSKDLGGYNIAIESDLRLDSAFADDFLRFIHQQRRGTFQGATEGKGQLSRLLELVVDWRDEPSVFEALSSIVDAIDFDAREDFLAAPTRTRRGIFEQLKQGRDPVEFYDFVFGLSYLEPVYDLKVDGKVLTELSPGERGGVLLVFYLMLDKRDIPLVIDQPEDNLDNKSVYEILVKFLKRAKKRRQIIIATHNPNLAVVADAEQIINVRIAKGGSSAQKNDFDFASGAIEDLNINRIVVDILEGTPPAFDNRRLKYRKQGS